MSIRVVSSALFLACGLLVANASALGGLGSPPVCVIGGPYNAECTGASTPVPIDGSGSYDPDNTPITINWFEECAFGFVDDPGSLQANYILDMTGVCQRQCFLVLRVSSGGQTTGCGTWVTVEDTLPPTLNLPSDVQAPWGQIDPSPNGTGYATATDLCDSAPVVDYTDTVIPQQGPGIEQTIIRHWTATDYCMHVAAGDQTIVLTSPSAGMFNLEYDVDECDDVLDRTLPPQFFSVTLLGRKNLQVNKVQRDTLRLSRFADPMHAVAPIDPYQYAPQQVAMYVATQLGECNPPGLDAKLDLRLDFDYAATMSMLGLDSVPSGTVVQIQVFGLRSNGTTFNSVGQLTVQ